MNRKIVFFAAFATCFLLAKAQVDDLEEYVETSVLEIGDGRLDGENFQGGVLQICFLKRLARAAETLQMIHERNIFSVICEKSSNCFVFDDSLVFFNEEIDECKRAIAESKSLAPFFELWSSVQKRIPQLDAPFLREFSLLVLAIYKTIYFAFSPIIQVALQKNIVLQAITMLCGNLSGLHAFELLSIIEKLTFQIPKLLEKYELTKSEMTWKEWVSKYWWLPPVAVSALVLESIFIYQVAVGARKLPRLKSLLRVFQNKKKNPIAIEKAAAM